MKLSFVAVAVFAFVLVGNVLGHIVCDYQSLTLKLAIDEDVCAQACREFSRELKGPCFAYEYDPESERCTGFVFDNSTNYGNYETCGIHSGAELTPPANTKSDEDFDSDRDGCYMYLEDLGPKKTLNDCTDACEELDSNVYGGCAAWFYNPETERCAGILSQKSYGKSVCASVFP